MSLGEKIIECNLISSLCITLVFFILIASSLSSCFKEKPLQPKKDGQHDKRIVIPMTPTYKNMYFFSLQSGTVIKESNPELYDLMFDNISGKFSIWLNGSKLMMIKRSGKTDFEKINYNDTLSTEGWLLDKPNYDIDSNAIGKWWSYNSGSIASNKEVYLINLGKDLLGNHLGYRKIQIESFAGNAFNIKYAFPDGSDEHTFSITQNNFTCYRYFSFQNGGQIIEIEPAKETWDIVFTRYSYIFYDPYYLPYLVVGGLSNPDRIESYVDSTVNYTDIKLTDLNNNYFLPNRDVIGYDWKKYDFTEYKTSPYRIYFIKTTDHQFYKLHFLDFYNEKFERGYPTFEYEEL